MQSCNANRSAFLNANLTISLPSAMPAALDGLGIITSIARPRGCHGSASGRTPPMLLISGNAALMLRAAKIVLTCRPCSGAISATSSRGASLVTTRHLDPRDAGADSAGPAFTLDWVHDVVPDAPVATCNEPGPRPSATEAALLTG